MARVDEVGVVVAYLSGAISGAATGGVYGESLPVGVRPPCVCVRSAGGESALHAQVSYANIDIACYGRSDVEARDLELAVRLAMEDGEDASSRMLYAVATNIGTSAVDDDWPEWSVVDGRYELGVFQG